MNKVQILTLFFTCCFLVTSCQKGAVSNGGNKGEWLVPKSEVLNGGPGKDGIPSIDQPQFDNLNEVTTLTDDDLVIAVQFEGETHLYPHDILDWHEIVNDEIANTQFALTYCPLTGTALNWNRTISGDITTFGVSGLLYNSNLMPYDRGSNSTWSQLELQCVNGERIGQKAEILPHLETTFATAKLLFPDAKVMNRTTGANRDYGRYPYGDYRSSATTLFPISEQDNRIFTKERVLGIIIESDARVYRFDNFSRGNIVLLEDSWKDQSFLILGSQDRNFMAAFHRVKEDGTALDFVLVDTIETASEYQTIMNDQFGNSYDILGNVVAGPDKGSRLNQPVSFIGYWFSFPAFYNEVEVFE